MNTFPPKNICTPGSLQSFCLCDREYTPSQWSKREIPPWTMYRTDTQELAISCYLLTVSPTDNQTELSPWIILFPEVCTPSCCFPSQHSVFFWRCSVSVQVLFHFLLTSAWSPAVPPPPHPPNAYSGLSYLGAQFFVDRLTAVCKALN